MTADDFRRLALSFPETSENAHMGHPDFRVRGKIFATLGYPGDDCAMVKLNPAEQEMVVRAEPKIFAPVKGGWGKRGATNVRLRAAKRPILRTALLAAWRNTAPKRLAAKFETDPNA